MERNNAGSSLAHTVHDRPAFVGLADAAHDDHVDAAVIHFWPVRQEMSSGLAHLAALQRGRVRRAVDRRRAE